MRGFFYLLWKEILNLLKDKSFYIWVLFMPLMFLFVFSRIGGGGKECVIVKDKVKNSNSIEFIEKLQKDFKVILSDNSKGKCPIIELSGSFDFKEKENTKVKIIFPENFSKGKEIYLKIDVYRIMFQLVAYHKLGIEKPSCFVNLKAEKNKLAEIPWGIRHTLPAIILMFILFNVLLKGTEKFYFFEENGLLERFCVSPTGYLGTLAFFLAYSVFLAMISVSVIFLLGILFFKFSSGIKTILLLYSVFFLFSVLCSSISVFFFSIIRKKEAAIGLGVLVANVLCALGGLWWPIEIVSPFLKKLGFALPTGAAISLIDGIVYFNLSFGEVLRNFLVLSGYSAVFFVLALAVFIRKYGKSH